MLERSIIRADGARGPRRPGCAISPPLLGPRAAFVTREGDAMRLASVLAAPLKRKPELTGDRPA